MSRPSIDEVRETYSQLALEVKDLLTREGAFRAGDEKPPCLSVREICDSLDITMDMWLPVKETMLQMGMAICWRGGKDGGHYLGYPGEQIMNVAHAHAMTTGWERRAIIYASHLRRAHQDEGKYLDYLRQKNIGVDLLNMYARVAIGD